MRKMRHFSVISKMGFVAAVMLSVSGVACAGVVSSSIPLAVDSVRTDRVDDSLVRIIQYNMEMLPKIEFELLSTPDVLLVNKLVVDKVKVGNEMIDFTRSAGVSVSDVELNNGVIHFAVDYFYPGSSGGEINFSCMIDVKGNKLASPVCVEAQ